MTATFINPNAAEQLLIKVGDGASPEVFTPLALINTSRTLRLTQNPEATVVPRTDDISAPGQTVRAPNNFDWQASGQGIVNVGDDLVVAGYVQNGVIKNVQVINNKTGGLKVQGPAIFTEWEETGGATGGKVNGTITIMGAGWPTLSAAS